MALAPQYHHSYRNCRQSLEAIIRALREVQGQDGATIPMLPPLSQELSQGLLESLRMRSIYALCNINIDTPLQKILASPGYYQRQWPNASRFIGADIPDGGIAMPFVHLFLREGDTLVFVDMPAASQLSPSYCNCEGMVPTSQVFRVHSEKLLALADSKFPDMLHSAQYQQKVMRHRKPTDEQLKGIEYILDLTPEIEGDNAACYISELSLTPGIIKWPASAALLGVKSELVAGHDDVCCCYQTKVLSSNGKKPYPMLQGTTSMSSILNSATAIMNHRGFKNSKLFENSPHLKISDYSPIRHANSIIRLMLMIEGKEVPLNSAARVWTMAGVSSLFGCPEVVREPVLDWIMSNPAFVEVLPEEALTLAFTFELPKVARLAFSILVNEAAIEGLGDDISPSSSSKLTAFGRQKGQVGDELSNIVQHATLALVDRLLSSFQWFEKGQTLTDWVPPPMRTLEYIESLIVREYDGNPIALDQVEDLRLAITRALKVVMSIHGCQKPDLVTPEVLDEMDRCRATYVEYDDGCGKAGSFVDLKTIMARLTPKQHLVCPFLYHDFRERLQDWTRYTNQFIIMRIELLEKVLQALRATPGPPRSPFPAFDLQALYAEVRERAQTWAWLETQGPGEEDLKPSLTRYMNLTLTGHEMKYMPLWAGGDNDGTGGVFVSALPVAELGPNGPGPAYHTGLSEAPSISDEVADEISRMKLRASTIVGSVDAQDSVSTIYAPDHVIAAGSSIASESFEDDDSEFRAAMLDAPSAVQSDGGLGKIEGETTDTSSELNSATTDSSSDAFDWLEDAYTDVSDDTIMGL